MNKTEQAYSLHLEAQRQAGDVLWWAFECLKLRLADATFYSPDFIVMLSDGSIEAHEVKGHWQDDARVKIKVAAETFPFRFKAFKKKGNGGTEEAFDKSPVTTGEFISCPSVRRVPLGAVSGWKCFCECESMMFIPSMGILF